MMVPDLPPRQCKIVAVDGPAGSGKSSVCAQACQKLGWTYVNTGFLYRSIAYICRERGKSLEDDQALSTIIHEFCASLRWEPEHQAVWFEGRNLAPFLYTDQAGKDASLIAKNPLVRDRLLPLQRKLTLLSPRGAIVDGRDIGTVVFPDADLKIFMTASIEERARRRIQQLHQGDTATEAQLELIKASILERDTQDAARGAAPLIKADDAIMFDTSSMEIDDAIQELIKLIEQKKLL